MTSPAMRHLLRARQLADLGRTADAVDEYRRVVALDPDDAWAHRSLAYALLNDGRAAEAKHEALDAVRLAPDDAGSHHALASVLWQADENKSALAAVERSIELDAFDADAQALLASILGHFNRWPASEAAARAALAIEPENTAAVAALANALRALGRGDEAEAALRDQLAHDAEDDVAHCRMGWHAVRAGRRREAIAHFREALRLDPTYADARYGLTVAIRSRSPLFGAFFRFLAWLNDRALIAVFVAFAGVLLAPRLLPLLAPASVAVQMADATIQFASSIFFSLWLMLPVIGLLVLRSDPDARASMTTDERRCARWHVVVLSLALVAVVTSPWTSGFFGLLAIATATAISLSVHHLFAEQEPAERRWSLAVVAVVMLLSVPLIAAIFTVKVVPAASMPLPLVLAVAGLYTLWKPLIIVALLLGHYGDDLTRWLNGSRRAVPWP